MAKYIGCKDDVDDNENDFLCEIKNFQSLANKKLQSILELDYEISNRLNLDHHLGPFTHCRLKQCCRGYVWSTNIRKYPPSNVSN
jgi:hypothetical protein